METAGAHISAQRKARYATNPKKYIERTMAWQRANPEKARAKALRYGQSPDGRIVKLMARHRYLQRQVGAPGRGVSAEQFAQLIASQGWRCTYCAQLKKLELDHVVPLSRGGAHDIENAVGACKRCNCSKGARLLSEWSRA